MKTKKIVGKLWVSLLECLDNYWVFANCGYKSQTITMTTIYGIKNCQTVQKALKFLDQNKIEYTFHDYKKQGIDKEHLESWCNQLGWQKILNRSGMMWRKALDEDKNKVIDQESAKEFMLVVPTSIKRPIVESGSNLLIGFDVVKYDDIFC
jgi:arsenate reductase (glutaredoxin)